MGVPSPHPPCPEVSFDDELERVEPDSLSESEDLASASLSSYDCDSEGEAAGDDTDSEDSDFSETRGTRDPPGVMNLKFRLNAVKAGKHCGLHLMQTPQLTILHSPE